MDTVELIIEILLFLLPLVVGAKYGPMALIGTAGLSVFILVEFLRLQPAAPPFGAIFIVLGVICATAAMTSAGGMELLVRRAGAAMRSRPNQIPIIGPLFVWLFTVLSGTGNITFALVPIMYEVSYGAKIRPERILATANAVCQIALMSSPVAAVTVTYLALTEAETHWAKCSSLRCRLPSSQPWLPRYSCPAGAKASTTIPSTSAA